MRVSGPQVRFVIETMCRRTLPPRRAVLLGLHHPVEDRRLDTCIALSCPAPASATGEDILELHLHGGPALVRDVLDAIRRAHPRIRFAEAGEFTRRALENGKLDLLEVEALGELLAAESSGQLAQARRQMSGELATRASVWRESLIDMRALIEAHLDFSDEGDVPADVGAQARMLCQQLMNEIRAVLASAERGQRMRDGVYIAIIGAPNVGKSSLLNAMARREAAIVSPVAGTTRDVIEVSMEIGGWPVVLQDTAGLRVSVDPIEQEGVRRALARSAEADIVLRVEAVDGEPCPDRMLPDGAIVIDVLNKCDLVPASPVEPARWRDAIQVSTVTGVGLDVLDQRIKVALDDRFGSEPALVSRERQAEALREATLCLERAVEAALSELMAEDLRLASRSLGKLVGQVDLEDVLDRLFQGFCIGK